MGRAALRVVLGGLGQDFGPEVDRPLPPLRLPALGDVDHALIDRLRALGEVSILALANARASLLTRGVPLGDGLVAAGVIDRDRMHDIEAEVRGWGRARGPLVPDTRLLDALGPLFCLNRSLVPLGRPGGAMVLATSRPDLAQAAAAAIEPRFGPVRFVLAAPEDIEEALVQTRHLVLTDRAEHTVPADESCRGWDETRLQRLGLAAAGLALVATALAPLAMLALATGIAMLALVCAVGLKMAALLATLRAPAEPEAPPRGRVQPRISIMVPLFCERDVVERLVRRLWGLTYPKDRLEICLVLEEDDVITRAALDRAPLPHWFRLIEVPRGTVKTKPRALNYALPFCRGEIIGIYDAEDAPEPDQLDRVARRFAELPPQVACLQGALDFYNSRDNLIARCFTIEYATWFRVVLPGLARLGLVVPLGGTTLFFRRRALERLGAWDAHNVTEDADLGLRLARHGYRTEILDTVTAEEANCRPWPWIRQRSRWLKGYAMTWASHMRAPGRLCGELGLRRFLGVQVTFLGTLVLYALAPLLWSFWALPLGLGHPLAGLLGGPGLVAATVLFLGCEVLNLATGLLACRLAGHRGLGWWLPATHLYFPLGTVAAWKGLVEIALCPYYWDKTAHGFTSETADAEAALQRPPRPAIPAGPIFELTETPPERLPRAMARAMEEELEDRFAGKMAVGFAEGQAEFTPGPSGRTQPAPPER